MFKQRSTKRALLASVMALLLCFSMLLGTTFAWFSDTVAGINNTIIAGNLDIELYWSTDAKNWQVLDETTDVFSDTPWEPGHAEVVYLKIVNEGDLALKYQFGTNIVSETIGTNKAGNKFKLSNYIKYDVIETQTAFADRKAAVAAVENAKIISAGYSQSKELLSKAEDYVALVLYMPTTVGNEANYKTGTVAPEIKLGISLIATQYTHEEDGYDDQYDADALACDILAYPDTIDEILATATEGMTIGLGEGTYNTIKVTQNKLTFVAVKSAKVGFMDLNAKDGVVINGLTFDASLAQPVISKKGTTAYVANISGSNNREQQADGKYAVDNAADDLTIQNCLFTGTPANVDAYAPICFEEQGRPTERAKNLTITGNTFECNAINYVRLNYLSAGDTFITHNTFGGAAYGTTHNTINATGNASNFTIIGNTFYNWNADKAAFGSSWQASFVQLVVNDNEFINLANATEFNVLNIKSSYTEDNFALTYNSNVGNYGKATLATEPVADGNDNLYKMTLTDTIDIGDVISNAEPGETVVLGDVDYAQQIMTIEGNVSDVVIDASASEDALFMIAADAVLENVTFKGLNIAGYNGIGTGYSGGVQVSAGAKADITFEDCSFAPNAGSASVGSSSSDVELTFVGCTFDGGRYAFYKSGANIQSMTFVDCTFKNVSSWIAQSHSAPEGFVLSVTDCTFENCAGGLFKYPSSGANCKFVFVGNTITNSTGHDGKDTKWFELNLTNYDYTISDNTKDGAAWNIEVNDGQGLTK